MLNKADPVEEAERLAIEEQQVQAISLMARLLTSANAEVPMEQVFGVEAFELERALSSHPNFLVKRYHYKHRD